MARKRRSGDDTPTPGVDPDVALFASYVRTEEQQEREAKRAAREERRRADQEASLVAAKDAAAAEVKRLRGRTGVSAEERAAADSAYRKTLAAVVAAETGEAPSWAPEPAVDNTEEASPPTDGDDAASGSAEPPDDAGATDPPS